MAKIAGRWSDGVPLARAPTATEWRKFNVQYPEVSPDKNLAGYVARGKALIDFTYKDDPQGLRCPISSHMRRVNTRDVAGVRRAPRVRCSTIAAASSGAGCLTATRQRGRPDSDEHGVVMLAACTSLFRQFEFVQQQWINYGLDADSGNDTCPLTGNHNVGADGPRPSS